MVGLVRQAACVTRPGEDGFGGTALNRIQRAGRYRVYVAGKIAEESLLAQRGIAVGVNEASVGQRRGICLAERRIILVGARRTRSAIDQRRDFRIDTRLRDDLATIGVRDQDGRAVLQGQRAARELAILIEGSQWILNRRDVKTGLLQ